VNIFDQVRAELAGKLTAADVAAVTVDPRAPIPCVLVDVPTVDVSAGVGGWRVTVPVRIIAAPPGGTEALTWMLDQLEAVMVLWPGAVPAAPGTYPRNDQDCPAYTVPVVVDVTNPTC
jgi:hypothetical protein